MLHPCAQLQKLIAGVVLMISITGSPIFAQTPQFPRNYDRGQVGRLDTSVRILNDALSIIDEDISGILRYPLENPETTSLFLLGLGALILSDVPVTSFYQDNVEPVFDGFRLPPLDLGPALNGFSTESRYLYAGVAGSYALGIILNDEKAQEAAVLAGKAVAYSYLTTHVLLKSGFGRNRPVQNLSTFEGDPGEFTTDPLDFGNFHGVYFDTKAYGTAMPSFHVTQYFAAARVYAGVYDNYWVPYGLAGVLFASNIKGHRHWVSDMVAGALIGTAIGEVVLDGYYPEQGNSISITPYASDQDVGIYFSKSF